MKTAFYLSFWIFVLSAAATHAQSLEEGLGFHFSAKAPGQDLSGKNNAGLWNNISLAPGIPGLSDSAFYFNGLDSYIEVESSPSLDRAKSMTMAMWYKPEKLPRFNNEFHLATRRFASMHKMMCLIIYPDGVIFGQTDGEKNIIFGLPEKVFFQKNTWYHVAGVFDGDKKEMRLYLNGILENTIPVDIGLAVPKDIPLHIGCDMRSDFIRERFFQGSMEDIRMYNRALSDKEIGALTGNFIFSKPEDAFEKIERLNAGRYILSQMDSSGRKGNPWQVVEISATEPLWKQGWFVAGCIAGTFLLTFLLVYWYNRRRQQEQAFEFEKRQMLERERFRIARDMHDDIGSGLSAINLLTEIALNKSKDPQLAVEIQRIATAARDVHARIQDIIWAISAQNDTLAGLVQHLQRFSADLLAPTGIVLQFDTPIDLPAHIIPGDRRRAVFLAFKEALHNIIKHARATRVDIRIMLSENQLMVCLRDNGRGFDLAATGDEGNGLTNMRKRMEEMGGQFLIKSSGGGTEVGLQMGW